MTSTPTATQDAATAALQRVLAGLDALAAIPGWQLSDEALATGVAQLERVSRLAAAQTARLAAQAARRGLPRQRGHRRLEHWVREQAPTMSPRAAAGHGRRAESLFGSASSALQQTRAAVLSGTISGEQADVVVDTLRSLSPPLVPADVVDDDTRLAAEAVLLDHAADFAAGDLRRIARRLVATLDPDADERLLRDEAARDRVRAFTLSALPSGMVHVDGLLTPSCGAALSAAIDAWSAPRPAADGTPDPRTAAQRRHDAVELLASKVLAAPDIVPSTHGSPWRVVVTAEAATLDAAQRGAARPDAPPATLEGGVELSNASLAALSCTADVVPVLLDGVGSPLDVGDAQRLFTPRQRAALAVRDAGCTWPGCGAPVPWTDAHHLIPWSAGGATDLDNAALVCGPHHRHVHRVGATGRVVDGTVRWDVAGAGSVAPGPGELTRAQRAVAHLMRRARGRRRGRDPD